MIRFKNRKKEKSPNPNPKLCFTFTLHFTVMHVIIALTCSALISELL